jgi:hypothetical protein
MGKSEFPQDARAFHLIREGCGEEGRFAPGVAVVDFKNLWRGQNVCLLAVTMGRLLN